MLAADSQDVFWIANKDVMVLQLNTSAVSPLGIADGGTPEGLAIDAANVYFTQGSNVMYLPRAGGSGPVALATGQASPGSIAVSKAGVFWGSYAASGTCTVMGLPLPP